MRSPTMTVMEGDITPVRYKVKLDKISQILLQGSFEATFVKQ